MKQAVSLSPTSAAEKAHLFHARDVDGLLSTGFCIVYYASQIKYTLTIYYSMGRKKTAKKPITTPLSQHEESLCSNEEQLILPTDVDFGAGLQVALDLQLEKELEGDLSPFEALTPSGSCSPSTERLACQPGIDQLAPATDTSEVLQEASRRLSDLPPAKRRRVELDPTDWARLTRSQKQTLRKRERDAARSGKLMREVRQIVDAFEYKPRPSATKRYKVVKTLQSAAETRRNLRACAGAWKGWQYKEDLQYRSLQDFLNQGLELVEWDGMCVAGYCSSSVTHNSVSTPIVITDKEDRIIAVLLGRPQDVDCQPSWQSVADDLYTTVQETGERLDFGQYHSLPKPQRGATHNRRGDYDTVT